MPGMQKGRYRNGFFVDVIKGKPMGPGKHVIVEKITPGMMALQRKGYISIEEIKDINVEVKKQVEHVEATNKVRVARQEAEMHQVASEKAEAAKLAARKAEKEAEALKVESVPASGFDKEAMKQIVKDQTEPNTTMVSGPEIVADEELSDGAINPDGEPNFVVTANKGKRRGKSKRATVTNATL